MERKLHIDLFSGIGGFALAADWVWPGMEHVFVDNDPFCQIVLKKHWPNSYIHGDIRTFTQDAIGLGRAHGEHGKEKPTLRGQRHAGAGNGNGAYLLTGGFPCQPFSSAGRRKGTADDRFLWPEMLRVIREFSPHWVIGENVGGFVTWNDGMVLREALSSLEGAGYEVQAFVIPACAVNAPHRRDRVWIVGHNQERETRTRLCKNKKKQNWYQSGNGHNDVTDASSEGLQIGCGKSIGRRIVWEKGQTITENNIGWQEDWPEVATRLCGIHDGLPARMDGLELSKAKHREQRLKALGNAIVPQVAIEIMRAILVCDPEGPHGR